MDPSQKGIKILIAEDHALVREGLKLILDRTPDMEVVGCASNGQEAVAMYNSTQPDVCLIDVHMPIVDGVSAIDAIRTKNPKAKFVVLSTYDSEEDVYRSLKAGAQSYMLKEAPREELIDAIRAVNRGEMRVAPEHLSKVTDRMRHPSLTPREVQVLKLIIQGMSNQAIANTLFVTEGTIKSHVNSLLAKMGVTDRTQAALAAVRRGLVRL